MTDYTKPSGQGTIMIRDTGTTVQFFIISGGYSTWINGASYSWVMNGSGSGSYDYPISGGWLLVRSANVTTSQTVTFSIGATGTGLGGPTSLSVAINRGPVAGVPPYPDPVAVTLIGSTTLRASFNGNGDGGSAILRWELGWSDYTSPSHIQHIITSTGTTNFTGLVPGTTYYFWARGVNSVGDGGWSSVRSATTLDVPNAPSPVVLSSISPSSMMAAFSPGSNGGSVVTEWQLAYGTNSATPSSMIHITSGVTSNIQVTGLIPGTTYYFWARGHNAVGDGSYSSRTTAKTISGSHVLVNGVWRNAIPYVRVNGVWKIAEPWAKVNGVWKKTG